MDPATRKFTIADAMTLVAATAVGLGGARWLILEASKAAAYARWFEVELALSCVGLCWTAALLGLRARRPRPGRMDAFRQPGCAAAVAVLVSVSFRAALLCGDLLSFFAGNDDVVFDYQTLSSYVSDDLVEGPIAVGVAPAVAAVWLVLALGGGWEPVRDWVDRCGRVLGWLWLGSAVAVKAHEWAT